MPNLKMTAMMTAMSDRALMVMRMYVFSQSCSFRSSADKPPVLSGYPALVQPSKLACGAVHCDLDTTYL